MKKIALVLTILSASTIISTINGMEGHYAEGMWKNIPKEAKTLIISYLHTYDNLDVIIDTIKTTSSTNRELNKIVHNAYGNPEGFRDLVQLLAHKFPKENPKTIAEKFGTATAKNYIALSEKLSENLNQSIQSNNFIDLAKPLIQEGADINYQSLYTWPLLYKAIIKDDIKIIEFLLENNANPNIKIGQKNKRFLPQQESPLIMVTWNRFKPTTLAIIKLLLKYGANANFKNSEGNTALDVWTHFHKDDSPEIEQLLKEAIAK